MNESDQDKPSEQEAHSELGEKNSESLEFPEPPPPHGPSEDGSELSGEAMSLGQFVQLVRLHAQIRHNFRVFLFTAFGGCPVTVLLLLLASRELCWAAYMTWFLLPLMVCAFAVAGPLWMRWRFRPLGKFARTVVFPNLPEGALKNGFIPAVELQEALERGAPPAGKLSEVLARAHIHQVEAGLSKLSPSELIPKSTTVQALKFALVAFSLSLAVGVFASNRIAQGLKFALRAPWVTHATENSMRLHDSCDVAVEIPVVGDVSIALEPPAYSGRSRSISQNSDGALFGLKGTQVDLRGTADRDVARAVMAFEDGTQVPLTVENGRQLSGRLTILTHGKYRFRLEPTSNAPTSKSSKKRRNQTFLEKTSEESENEKKACWVLGPPIEVSVEPDGAPEISLVIPQKGGRVQADGVIPLHYEASDDFGLKEIALVYQLPSEQAPRRVVLQSPKTQMKTLSGDEVFELSGLPLAPSDRLSFYLEAVDNDVMSGPKVAVSKTETLEIYSSAQRYREAVNKLSGLWDRLIHHLADRLESPDWLAFEDIPSKMPTREQLVLGRTSDANGVKLAEDLVAAVKPSLPVMVSLSGGNQEGKPASVLQGEGPEKTAHQESEEEVLPEQIREAVANAGEFLLDHAIQLGRLRDILGSTLKVSASQQEEAFLAFRQAFTEEVITTERSIVYLESLLDEARAATLLVDAGELKESRRRVADLLEELRTQTGDHSEKKAQILSEMARLKNRMAQLLTRMGDLSRTIQDAHVNEEAMREVSEARKSMDGFSKMEALLKLGDVEGAMKALDEIGAAMETLEKKLAQASEEIGDEMDHALGRKLKKFARDLQDAITTQKGQLQTTGKLLESEKARRTQALAEKEATFTESLIVKTQEALQLVRQIQVAAGYYVEEGVNSVQATLENMVLALQLKDLFRTSKFASETSDRLTKLSSELERQRRFFSFGATEEVLERQAQDVERAKKAQELVTEVREALDKISTSLDSQMGERLAPVLSSQSEAQGDLAQKTSELMAQMGDINRSAPLFPSRAQSILESAQSHMSEAQKALQSGHPTSAFRAQTAASELLELLQKGLNQEESSQSGRGGQDSSSKGDASPNGQTTGSRGKLVLSKGGKNVPWPWGVSQSFGGFGRGKERNVQRGDRPTGFSEVSSGSEKVQIPQRGGGEASEAFRREVLDGMKGKAPKEYREEVRRYYEQIVK